MNLVSDTHPILLTYPHGPELVYRSLPLVLYWGDLYRPIRDESRGNVTV